MKGSIEKLRYEYGNKPLLESELESDPIRQFTKWLEEAMSAKVMEPNGMTLATVGFASMPASRMVLLKKITEKGFIFFTNYESRKGKHLTQHPFASLNFWWKEIFRQVNVEGKVQKVPRKESEAYFQKRPRGAQLAASISPQSQPLANRLEIETEFKRLQNKYRGKEIPCPKSWGGYLLQPDRMEFWQGRKNRLHDRFLYVKVNGEWILTRLAP